MTATTDPIVDPLRPPAAETRARRPVLSFVALLGVVIVALFALTRSGAASPQVGARVESELAGRGARKVIVVDVENDGWRPAEVVGLTGADGLEARVLDPGVDLRSSEGEPTDLADRPPFRPFTLPGGGNRSIVLTVADGLDCTRTITVLVRSADLGIARQLEVAYC